MTTKSKNPVIVEKVEQIKQSHVPIVGTDESKKLEGISHSSFKENIFLKKDTEIREKKKQDKETLQQKIEIATKKVEEELKDKKDVPESVIKKLHTKAKERVTKLHKAASRKTKDLAKEKKIELRSKRYLREYHHIRTKLRYSKSISKKRRNNICISRTKSSIYI